MEQPKLYMLLLGCRPAGRNTEQHDIFFGIANTLKDLVPQIGVFWRNAGTIHIDGWREVTTVDGYAIKVSREKKEQITPANLFFLNLGGYKENEFEEYHYKMLAVSTDKGEAVRSAKQTAFYKHTGFKGAESHIDDKYGVDIDDVFEIKEILPPSLKEQFHIHIEPASINEQPDELHLGYFKLNSL